jgi:hypothetical protein
MLLIFSVITLLWSPSTLFTIRKKDFTTTATDVIYIYYNFSFDILLIIMFLCEMGKGNFKSSLL